MRAHLLPTLPADEKLKEPTPAATRIFKGLLKSGIKPVQALIFMAIYQQFPERFIPANDFYFWPSMRAIIANLKIKPAVYHHLVRGLVEGGYLKRRKHQRSGTLEYRIVFEKLNPFIREAT